jgi:hypothetical protein
MTRTLRDWVAVAFVLGLATAPGCSGETCKISLAKSGCATTLDLQVQNPPIPGLCGLVGSCGAYRVWQSEPNYFSLVCVYDGSGQNLLSGTTCGDTPICGGNQFCEFAGQNIDVSICASALPRLCPTADAGTNG